MPRGNPLPDVKRCRGCGLFKSRSEYTQRKSPSCVGGFALSSRCKVCINAQTAVRRLTNKAWLEKLKSTTPCMDCGGIFHSCQMDFDHVRGTKKFQVCNSAAIRFRHTIEAEMSKCELVCANCHRLRTYRRLTHSPA